MHWPDPCGAIEVTADAGDAVLLDRRIWHTRYRSYSPHTRKAVFFGYTYGRAAIRDDITPIRASGLPVPPTPSSGRCSVSSRTRRGPPLGGHGPVLDALEPVLLDGGQLGWCAAGAEIAHAVLHVRPGALDRV
jgi:hypothetical protein